MLFKINIITSLEKMPKIIGEAIIKLFVPS